MSLAYTCILALKHRYVPLLGTSLFSHYGTRLLLVCNYKAVLFFFKLFKYLKKSKNKNKKPKIRTRKDVIFWQLSSRVSFKQRTIYHIHWLGLYFDFRSYTHLSEFVSTNWLSFQSPWSLCRCLLCHRDVLVLYIESMLPLFKSPFAVMLLFEGS